MAIPRQILGKIGVEVTRIGLGGEGVLRTFGRERDAKAVIGRALDLGITYFESARAYSGSESYYGSALGEARKKIFLTSKSHDRSASGALRHLETTLANMKTDWLDLWQVHDVRDEADLEAVFGPGGAIEAFDRAKEDGKVRFVGITGHQDPHILLKAFDLYDFDTVLMPVNPAEPAYLDFMETVLPEANRRGMGTIGMKVLLHGFGLKVPGCTAEALIRYALAKDVSTVVVGCDHPGQVEENVAAAEKGPLSEGECRRMEELLRPAARQFLYYK